MNQDMVDNFNMSMISAWLYVRIQSVFLIAYVIAPILAMILQEILYRYGLISIYELAYPYDPFPARIFIGWLTNLINGFLDSVILAIAFSVIIPRLLIMRIKMKLPIWLDYVLAEAAVLSVWSFFLMFICKLLPPSFSWFKTFHEIGLFLPVAFLFGIFGVLVCRRLLIISKRPIKHSLGMSGGADNVC